jgi:dTDP-4-amino-4,6-dideoxygalactose transaminase
MTLADCQIVDLPKITDPRGNLTFIEGGNHVAFDVRRPNRDALQSLIHYPVPAHLSGAYRYRGMSKGARPLCEALSNELLSFPIGPQMKEVEADYIVKSAALLGS